jgi:hypothetical protein
MDILVYPLLGFWFNAFDTGCLVHSSRLDIGDLPISRPDIKGLKQLNL